MIETTTENDTLEISKSQRKRDAQELLELAKDLVSMPVARLKRMPMEQELRDEIEFARSIKAHGARKRQLMTVGKMLRQRDNQALLDAVNDIDQKDRQANARFHHIETWRDRLLEGSDQVLSELLEQIPDANAQILRQLIRNAQKEVRLEKPPASARKLFKLLREMDAGQPLPPLT
ncbi:MAG TPA: ribosome biogenesis factor YjgA [Xanthomonadales bacterium]